MHWCVAKCMWKAVCAIMKSRNAESKAAGILSAVLSSTAELRKHNAHGQCSWLLALSPILSSRFHQCRAEIRDCVCLHPLGMQATYDDWQVAKSDAGLWVALRTRQCLSPYWQSQMSIRKTMRLARSQLQTNKITKLLSGFFDRLDLRYTFSRIH